MDMLEEGQMPTLQPLLLISHPDVGTIVPPPMNMPIDRLSLIRHLDMDMLEEFQMAMP